MRDGRKRIRFPKQFSLTAAMFFVSTVLIAQSFPPVGTIDFYGMRNLQESAVLEALSIHVGQTLSSEEALRDAERRLRQLPGVDEARVTLTCCDAGTSSLYVGIRERGTRPLKFSNRPMGDIRLSDDIVKAGEELQAAIDRAVLSGQSGDAPSNGHSLAASTEVREVQKRVIVLAAKYHSRLRAVLHGSRFADQRALAAEFIGYGQNQQQAAADLTEAIVDPAPEVRNNAMRALAILGSSEENRKWIRAAKLVQMLSSVEWSDRNKAAAALGSLTSGRPDPKLLATMRHRAVLPLAEMARWHAATHARTAFVLLGRIGNLSDERIERFWSERDLTAVLHAAESPVSAGDS